MSWIQTYTGLAFEPAAPRPEQICIEDIAHALSMTCRYNGHTSRFYSVAEHCSVMSWNVSREAQPYALMHDAAEAYVSDLARPIKPLVAGFQTMEDRIQACIMERFAVPVSDAIRAEVKEADRRMLQTERRQLMTAPPHPWDSCEDVKPYAQLLRCESPEEAKHVFLFRFYELFPDFDPFASPSPAALAKARPEQD